MATIHLRNAKILAGGYDLSGDHAQVSVDVSAEMLDETAFGDTTRIRKGGLTVANISGSGHWDASAGRVDAVMFGIVGTDDSIIAVFPNGITEGTSTDKGFAFKGVVEKYDLTGDVGSLLGFATVISGRGIEA